MTKGSLVTAILSVAAVIVAIAMAMTVARGHWPAGAYAGNLLEAGAKVAGALFVIAVFLERAMAVVNDIVFGAETVDLDNRARKQLLEGNPDLPITEYEQKRLDADKKRVRLAGSFLAAVLISAAGARSLGGLFVLTAIGTPKPAVVPAQANLFLVMDVLLTAGVLAGGSSGIAAIIDLLRKRADAAKAELDTQRKAAWLGIIPSALRSRYERAGFPAHDFGATAPAQAIPARKARLDPNEPDDAAAFREWSMAEPDDAAGIFKTAERDWRPAKALEQLRHQLDASYPSRSTTSDGTIGDARHCETNPASSDHCPNIPDGAKWVVTAFDATHDPGHGCDMNAVTGAVVGSRDPRIKYVIWNRRICASYAVGSVPAWTWRAYGGDNPHDKHAHFSVRGEKQHYDDERSWSIV